MGHLHVKKLPPPPTQLTINDGITSSNKEVKQKMYELPTEETTMLIKKFKDSSKKTLYLRSSQNSLALDSSIWLLEAALNFDFDSPKSTEIGYKDSIKYSVKINNSKINSLDFNLAYDSLSSILTKKVNKTTKIQVLDVTARLEGESILYLCEITLFNKINSQRINTPCDPFTTETASPSLYPTSIPSYTNSFLSCSGNPVLDGPTEVEIKLNSCSMPACNNGYYYTNVITNSFNGLNFPSKLYYRSINSYSGYCLTSNKIITALELNQYKNGCNYLASFYKPTTPSGLSIINNYDLSLEITGSVCCYWPHSVYWVLKVQYGILHCNNGGGA